MGFILFISILYLTSRDSVHSDTPKEWPFLIESADSVETATNELYDRTLGVFTYCAQLREREI